jgi:glycosyltransferase involved in cell wall biosynthesis
MNVVLVSSGPCYPPTAGNRIRILSLLVRLAQRHRITYVFREAGEADEAEQTRTYLLDHGIETVVVHDPLPSKKGPRFYARLAANLFSPLPYSVVLHESSLLRHAVAQHAARQRAELCQVEWFPHAHGLRQLTGAPSIVIAHDIVSVLWQRHHEAETNPLKRWYIREQWRKFERFERQIYTEADRVVAVSPEDARLLRERMGVTAVDVVDNGVDNNYFAAVAGEPQRGRILFLGTLESRPNLDGVRQMLDRVFPAVRAREPSARLCIVGRNPPPWLYQRVHRMERVELHGSVADVRPYMGLSDVMAVPLRIGGGSRIKILEALAAGLPVVSTRVGIEGLCLTACEHLAVVEDVEGMAAALVEMIRNPAKARTMVDAGRRVVRERYDWDILAVKLEKVWESVLRATVKARR